MDMILIDLERSIKTGIMHYWKSNKRGYTNSVSEAGSYSVIDARNLIIGDLDKRTVAIPKAEVDKILGM